MSSFTEIGIAKQDYANISIDALPGVFIKSIKAKQIWKENTVDDSQGATAGKDARDEAIEMDIDFALTGTTKALAAANGVFTIPLSGVAISWLGTNPYPLWLSSAGTPGGLYKYNWIYNKGGDRSLMADKNGEGTMSLLKFADPAQ